ncbi:ABC transporter permease [Halopiger aswanensis]|uniref:Spermidine/putrescine transport system permease protein n=1 Tax=Halopiger aswanensis TaxID=148449 RepID=A0A419WH81_9EURY|nr:ABC transporter permease [Halopiger aswanensis]RKD94880.1 spermidine/putrescine transport system permease protein [Halopiger aswanensis]
MSGTHTSTAADAGTGSGVLERLRAPLAAAPSSRRALLLMAPLLVFEALIFVVPFLMLLRISFAEGATAAAYQPGTWSLEAYTSVLGSGLAWDVIQYSFAIGAAVTVITIALGLCYAYAIWRANGVVQSILLFSVVLPLLTTLVVKTYAFRPLLTPEGTLNDVLMGLHVISEPVSIVPGTAGAIIGQVYIVLPYAVLAIYSVMATMDWQLVEAARDLGASRPRSVLEVVVPRAMPGIIVATVISFAWSVGAYAAPFLLAGGDISFAVRVEKQLLQNFQWPEATALSVIMIVLMLVSIAAIVGVLSRFGGEFDYA